MGGGWGVNGERVESWVGILYYVFSRRLFLFYAYAVLSHEFPVDSFRSPRLFLFIVVFRAHCLRQCVCVCGNTELNTVVENPVPNVHTNSISFRPFSFVVIFQLQLLTGDGCQKKKNTESVFFLFALLG